MNKTSETWRQQAAGHARRMSEIRWTPVADGVPMLGGGTFQKGTEYTGLPYSSVKSAGKYLGFDIFLKTFLAAVENPVSVLYTKDLTGKMDGGACYYGKVCSTLTSYALQLGTQSECIRHMPPCRHGIERVTPQSAQAAEVGDIIYRKSVPECPTAHVEIVTEVTRNRGGKVTYVRADEATRPMIRHLYRRAESFDEYITSGNRALYRITDVDAWRDQDRAEAFLFPNYSEDAANPVINRTLLLDLGDWAVYEKGQPVKFNLMDRDGLGIDALILKRDGKVIEELRSPGKGVVERGFADCGDYTAYCLMRDGAESQPCEFSVCELDFDVTRTAHSLEIEFAATNTDVRILRLRGEMGKTSYHRQTRFVTENERQSGRIRLPVDKLDQGAWQVLLIGENRYGRVKKRKDIQISDAVV